MYKGYDKYRKYYNPVVTYKNAGYNNATLCCDHEPETYEDKDFKVCWTPETTCKTNADCGAGEFCNLKNETDYSCYYPTSGKCEQITTDDYTDANVEGLGNVRRSTSTMTWGAADNWCKVQGMNLIDVSKFKCYYTGTNNPISTDNGRGYCCKGNNQACSSWYNYWNGNTIKSGSETTVNNNYSPEFVNLRKAFGSDYFWTASDYSSTDSCRVFLVALYDGFVSYNDRYNDDYALCE